MAKKKTQKRKKVKKIIILLINIIILAGLIYLTPKILTVYKLYRAANSYVAASSESTFKDSKTTIIYDTDGNELCTMKSSKDLYYVNFKDIPTAIANAFVVTEDRNFYNHSGIDLKAIVRAVVVNQQNNEIAQGASTITQQLARNIFLSQEVTWERKVEEIFIAVGLEKKYSKEQILEFYLNNIYFGNGYYGVEAAARGYFGKSISELSLSQQAFIAAIPNNPTRYNPLTNFDNTLKRRDLILDEMYQAGDISTLGYYAAKDETITLTGQETEDVNNSVVTYARHCATEAMMQAAGFTFRYNFESDSDYDTYENSYETYYTMCQQKLLSGGYSIYTSLNMNIQNQLQQAIDQNLAGYTDVTADGVYQMQSAATCVDNATGNVVAIVGSRSQNLTGYTLNRAYQSYRQPGSCIKPLIVYTPFLQLGNTPDTIVDDEPIDGGPSNADGTYAGNITLREAVRLSKNTVAWKLYDQITPKAGSSYLLKMGFKKVWMDKNNTASALGGFSYGVTTEEMAGGYAAIANDGVYRKPTCVKNIINSAGSIVIDEKNRELRIYDTNSCRMMTDMLKTVVESGTGTAANVSDAIVAGKTGTTNSNKDAWFCGYSKYYTTAVWMGYDYPKAMSNANIHANTIFKQFMTAVHTNLKQTDFPQYAVKASSQPSTAATTDTSIAGTVTVQPETTPITSTTTTEGSSSAIAGTEQVTKPSTAPKAGGATTAGKTQSTTQSQTVQYGDVDATTTGDKDAGNR